MKELFKEMWQDKSNRWLLAIAGLPLLILIVTVIVKCFITE